MKFLAGAILALVGFGHPAFAADGPNALTHCGVGTELFWTTRAICDVVIAAAVDLGNSIGEPDDKRIRQCAALVKRIGNERYPGAAIELCGAVLNAQKIELEEANPYP